MKNNAKKKIIIIAVAIPFFLFAALFFMAQAIAVYPQYIIEAGSDVSAERFVRIDFGNVSYDEESEFFETGVPGHYTLRIKDGLFTHTCRLIIIDSVPPSVSVRPVTVGIGESCEPRDFIEGIDDVTECEVTYAGDEPGFNETDTTQEVGIRVTDAGGNATEVMASLTVIPVNSRVEIPLGAELPGIESFVTVNEEAAFADDMSGVDTGRVGEYPVNISFRGSLYTAELVVKDVEPPVFTDTSDKYLMIGEPIVYRSLVTVTDDSGECEITVDTSQVDATRVGTYDVSYLATDPSGNTSSAVLTIHISEYSANEAKLYERIDGLLKEITTEDMSEYDKALAIYKYITSHMNYVADTGRMDYVTAASYAIDNMQGDCYVYASLAQAFFTRAGIKNMMISKRTSDPSHDWNLVDIGDGHGWYHFDATPRADRPVIFLWDDKRLSEYSEAHGGSHDYDRAAYPGIL